MSIKISKNKIYIVGSIDEESYLAFSEKLTEFESKRVKEVTVELNSPGGSAYDALAFYGRMKSSACNITVVAYGLVASAAVLVLAAGDVRYMSKWAWAMVHEDSVHKMSGKVTEVEKFGKHMRKLEDQWNILLAANTRLSAVGWGTLHKSETYLTAEECKRYGLVEGVL